MHTSHLSTGPVAGGTRGAVEATIIAINVASARYPANTIASHSCTTWWHHGRHKLQRACLWFSFALPWLHIQL